MIKRLMDIAIASVGLILFSPVMILCALLVKLTSKGPAFFKQERVGLNFRPFQILKFRSMVVGAPKLGAAVTVDGDPRITTIGRLMRKSKLDELPQLFNVLKGDMSLVGPRPEVPEYVHLFQRDYQELLSVRPGITDISSITYRYEEEILAAADDPREAYISEVLPAKIELGKSYIERSSVLFDLKLIFITAGRVFGLFKNSAVSGI